MTPPDQGIWAPDSCSSHPAEPAHRAAKPLWAASCFLLGRGLRPAVGGGSRGWTHHPSLCPLEQQRGQGAGANSQGQAPSADTEGLTGKPGLDCGCSWRERCPEPPAAQS